MCPHGPSFAGLVTFVNCVNYLMRQVFHALSACSALALIKYLEHHNTVASLIHRHVCE